MRYSICLPLTLSTLLLAACSDSPAGNPDASPPPDSQPPAPSCVRDQAAPSGIAVDTSTPRYQLISGFPSAHLGNTRMLRVFLPPSYATATSASYPVIYMHDGQNLFDAATAGFGMEWQVDETVDRLVAAGAIPEVIVVGIDNTPDRYNEYTMIEDPTYEGEQKGGKGPLYAKFVVEEVKPYIDSTYRTLCGPDSTVLAGSSLGGLISFEMSFLYPSVFGKYGVMSPSFWWKGEEIVARMQELEADQIPQAMLWIDAGTAEGNEDADGDGLVRRVDNVRDVRDRLITLGHRFAETIGGLETPGAGHEEPAWAERLDDMLLFFLGTQSPAALTELELVTYGPKVALQGTDKDKLLHTIVTGTYANGMRLTVPSSLVAFTVADDTVASVDSAGVVHASALGMTTLSAAYGGKSAPPVGFEVIQEFPATVDITFDITVPATTPADKTVTLAGTMNSWRPSIDSFALEKLDDTRWRGTFSVPRSSNHAFKLTLQPQTDAFFQVEKNADCAEITNRNLVADTDKTYTATVANWRNVAPCGN